MTVELQSIDDAISASPAASGRDGTLRDFWIALRPVAGPLGVGLLFLGYLFWSEGAAAVGVWESSTAYNHCFFVIPISLY